MVMPERKRIAFHTLGCKLNYSETAAISRQFASNKFLQVHFNEVADIYVINSCTVTGNAEKKCKELIKKAIRTNPLAQVAVMGCFSEISPEIVSSTPGVSLVLGNAEKFELSERLNNNSGNKKQTSPPDHEKTGAGSFIPAYSVEGRTRSFFKIQDGCDYTCAYCTIPLARGKSRSDTIAATLRTAGEIAQTHIKEIVLTGVNIGDFGKVHRESLYDFLKELITIDGLERIRLSSIEPDLLHDNIIELVAGEAKLMPHFHMPLQSGSNSVLKTMGRRYNTGLFASRIETIRRHIPHACIAADVIVGHPGETVALFEESSAFIENIDVSYLHVFTYSERNNTSAATHPGNVHNTARKTRSKRMQQLSAQKKQSFIASNRGLNTSVLWEKDHRDGFMFGFSENYLRAKTRYDQKKINTIQPVQLYRTDEKGIYIL